MKKVQLASNHSLDMEIGEDCVVFAGRCICHEIDRNAKVMIQKAKAAGKTKVVIVGDCDDHHGDEKMFAVMSKAGIECKWFPEETTFLRYAAPNFSQTAIRRFGDAEDFSKLRDLLEKIGRRVYEIQQKIEREQKLLAEYPVVAKIKTIESHDHNNDYKATGRAAFNSLFGKSLPNVLVSEVNAVMLLNPANNAGLLVTKSQEIKFVLAHPHHFDLEILQGRSAKDPKREGYTDGGWGSVRINVGEGSPELSIYCSPGVWKITPHSELDTMDPDVHYVPMWQRAEKAK